MYQQLYDFAIKHKLTQVPNTVERKICGHILIDREGNFKGLDIIYKKNRKKIRCPTTGTFSATANGSEFIVAQRDYILCDSEIAEGKVINKHKAYIDLINKAAVECESLRPFSIFLDQFDKDKAFRDNVLQTVQETKSCKGGDFISIKVDGNPLESDSKAKNWLDTFIGSKKAAKGTDMIPIVSSITGKTKAIPSSTPFPMIRASICGSGSYVFSAKHESSQSYGMINEEPHIATDEALAIKAALDYLLDSPKHFNRNFDLLHWYDGNGVDLLDYFFGNIEVDEDDEDIEFRDNDRELSVLLNELISDESATKRNDATYNIMTVKIPSKGRIYIYNNAQISFDDLYQNIKMWYDDSSVECTYYDKDNKQWATSTKRIKKIYNILISLLKNPNGKGTLTEKVDKEFGISKNNLLRAAIFNEQIPTIFLIRAIDYFSNQMVKGENIKNVSVQTIKIYLRRNGEDIMPGLNEKSTSVAYQCGRLFATYERIQLVSNKFKKLNKGLDSRFFTFALKNPSMCFAKLAQLSISHLKKIDNSMYLSNVCTEIASHIGDSFPKTFSNDEKGQFILGYYQQKNNFNIKFEKETTDNE